VLTLNARPVNSGVRFLKAHDNIRTCWEVMLENLKPSRLETSSYMRLGVLREICSFLAKSCKGIGLFEMELGVAEVEMANGVADLEIQYRCQVRNQIKVDVCDWMGCESEG
jgi:hypothetical protein